MKSTFLLSILLFCIPFSYPLSIKLCEALIEEVVQLPKIECYWLAPGAKKSICTYLSKIQEELVKGNPNETCKEIGFYNAWEL
ncbi:hypothetical protein V3C99_019007 [Haemonchus contortus]|uniref:Alpha-lactalbumin n=1 Tax=Haemonchus contortus TaxID=6289 RepID=A0A7I4Z311_HAECO|nr:unnamed protein product [Haemonchus contortus]